MVFTGPGGAWPRDRSTLGDEISLRMHTNNGGAFGGCEARRIVMAVGSQGDGCRRKDVDVPGLGEGE